MRAKLSREVGHAMFAQADTVLDLVDLEAVTPEEVLSIVQQLPADILHSAHFPYYEGLFCALAVVAEAALRNMEKQNDPKGVPV